MPEDRQALLDAILASSSYRLAENDPNLLRRPELRPVRLQLELLKPEMALAENGVRSTIVVFGGTRIVERPIAEALLHQAEAAVAADPENPVLLRQRDRARRVLDKSHYYDEAREFARIVSGECQINGDCDYVVVTGGGPGIMEAGNRGAADVGAKSIGLNITLPHEQVPNPYITPELCFQFRYFALRKMHFLLRAKALVIFPGGFGTLDEFFDALTLRQTRRLQEIPILMYSRSYWEQVLNLRVLADEGVIEDSDLELIRYVESPQEAWDAIRAFHAEK
jgi:uncharacterized protein (TIGR00730 family)